MKRSYAQPVLILMLILLAAGVLAAGRCLHRSQCDNCPAETEHLLSAVADSKAGELLSWRKERLADVELFHKNSAFSVLVPDSPWFLAAGMDNTEVTAPKRTRLWLTVLFVAALLSALAGAAGFLWRHWQVQFYRKQTAQECAIAESLRESEEKYRVLFESSPDAYLIVADGLFVDCNPAAEAMIRGDRNRLVGRPPACISPEFQPDGQRSSEAVSKINAEALRTGHNRVDWVHRRFDGTEFWVDVSIASMTMRGQPVLFVTWRDISERKRAEESLREHSTELAAANAELTRFNRAAAHRELRMIELKQEVNELCRQLGQPPRYALEFLRTAPPEILAGAK